MDAAALMKTVTKFTGEINDPDNVPEAVATVPGRHHAPQGAAAVICPRTCWPRPTGAASAGPSHATVGAPPPRAINKCRPTSIRQAQRPALLVGSRGADPQSCTGAAGPRAAPGCRLWNLPGRRCGVAVLEDHYLGRVGLFRNQPGDVVLANADVLVAVGYDAVEYDPVLWNVDVERTVVHIDTVPADVDNHYQPVLELRGSVARPWTS